MENTEEVLAVLGTPLPGVGTPVQISPLDIEPDIKKDLARNAEKAKRKFEDMPYSQQAALLCADRKFWSWLSPIIESEDECVSTLRRELDIKSRAELDVPEHFIARTKFEEIRDAYRTKTRSYPEQRG